MKKTMRKETVAAIEQLLKLGIKDPATIGKVAVFDNVLDDNDVTDSLFIDPEVLAAVDTLLDQGVLDVTQIGELIVKPFEPVETTTNAYKSVLNIPRNNASDPTCVKMPWE